MLNQIENKSNVLPFRITAVKIPVADLEKILDQLAIASYFINADYQLDWEDRNEAGRAIYDALDRLRQLKNEVNKL